MMKIVYKVHARLCLSIWGIFPSKLSVLKLAFVLKMLEILTFILNLIFKDMYIEEGQVWSWKFQDNCKL